MEVIRFSDRAIAQRDEIAMAIARHDMDAAQDWIDAVQGVLRGLRINYLSGGTLNYRPQIREVRMKYCMIVYYHDPDNVIEVIDVFPRADMPAPMPVERRQGNS